MLKKRWSYICVWCSLHNDEKRGSYKCLWWSLHNAEKTGVFYMFVVILYTFVVVVA